MMNSNEYPYNFLNDEEFKTVKTPHDQPFYESLKMLFYIAEVYPDDIRFAINKPASDNEIDDFDNSTGIKLSEELKSFYTFTNGMYSDYPAGIDLYSLEEIKKLFMEGSYDWCSWTFDDYIEIGTYGGMGDQILFERKTGHILMHDHEEEEMESGLDSLADLFDDQIDTADSMVFIEDQRIKDYGHL